MLKQGIHPKVVQERLGCLKNIVGFFLKLVSCDLEFA